MTEHRSYYAIIPANVRYDKRLKPNTKLLYGEITALCNERGFCWAGNEYFADLYGVNKETISRWVSDLIKFGYLNREIIYKEGTNQIINPLSIQFNVQVDVWVSTMKEVDAFYFALDEVMRGNGWQCAYTEQTDDEDLEGAKRIIKRYVANISLN